MKSYGQAIEFYDKRIALGIDSNSASIYKNAGYCASNMANGQGEEEDDLEEDVGRVGAVREVADLIDDEDMGLHVRSEGVDEPALHLQIEHIVGRQLRAPGNARAALTGMFMTPLMAPKPARPMISATALARTIVAMPLPMP